MIPKLRQDVTLNVSQEEFEQAKKAISDIRLSNKQLRSAFGSLVNNSVSETFTYIEDSLNQISRVFEAQSTTVKSMPTSSSTSGQYTMKRHSLTKIIKMSLPRQIPKSVTINGPTSDIEVYGHMYKLIVLFSSLIENSIQAMNNSGKITINATAMGDKSRIEITDSGPGISDEVLDKLFSTLATTKKHGSGLGTKMAKSIVDLHKGNISVRNNPTTFTIELPFS